MTVAELKKEADKNLYTKINFCECGGRIWKEDISTEDGFWIRDGYICDLCEKEDVDDDRNDEANRDDDI